MKTKTYVEIDASSWLESEGILTSVWIGEGACEPCYEQRESYEDAIDKELIAHTVHDKLTGENIAIAEQFVHSIEWAAVYARKRFEELKDV